MTVAAPQTPNNETAEFLANLYAGFDTGFVTLFGVHPDRENIPPTTRWAPATCAADLAADAAGLHGWNIWVGCATRREQLEGSRRGGNDECVAIPALWVDIDIAGPGHAIDGVHLPSEDQAFELINQFPLPPTVIVHSGHGLQPWWALQEPHDVQGSDLLARWGATWARRAQDAGGFHLDNVYDEARIMRLPGTINTKAGCPPVPVAIEVEDWTNRYGIDDIEQFLDAAPPQPAGRANKGIPYIGLGRPGDEYNDRHNTAEQLAALGFIPGRVNRDGTQNWEWPNAAGKQSATTYPDGHCAIWSETAARDLRLKLRHGYDPYGLYVDSQHAGDYSAAARHLAANGYGTPPVELGNLIAPSGDGDDTQHPATSRWLPDDFWNARPYLQHIRQAAWARTASPDAVLHAVLARVAANTKHTYVIPPIVGTPGSLNYYAALIAASGAGKTIAVGISDELVPTANILQDVANNVPLGSGEGLAEAFMGEKEETDEDGKKKKVRAQVRWNAFVVVDEGAALTAMMERSGTTILEALRRGWSGQTLGQANASTDRRRIIHNYRLGLIVAFQPALAGRLLADHHAGTPQRFIYASGTDPNIPDDTPDWPGPLNIPPISANLESVHEVNGKYTAIHLSVDPSIATRVKQEHINKARGTRIVAELDSHEPMHRLKTAGLLAILDGRLHITEDDWALADTIWGTSCAVRSWLAQEAAQAQRDATAATAIRRAETSIIEDEHRATHDERQAARVARRIALLVHEKTDAGGEWEGGATPGAIKRILASRDRKHLEDAIQIAVDEHLIVDELGRLQPGKNIPR